MIKRAIYVMFLILVVAFIINADATAEQTGLTISNTKGKVEIRIKNTSTLKKAIVGVNVSEGDLIITENLSFAIIKSSSGDIVTIMQNSAVTIVKAMFTKNKVSQQYKLDSGIMYSKVNKLTKQSTFEVRTPTAVSGVRGTTFSVESQKGVSTFRCLEGNLEVTQGKEKYVLSDQQRVEATKEGLTKPEKISEREIKNIERDMNIIESDTGKNPLTSSAYDSVRKIAITRPGLKSGVPFTEGTSGSTKGSAQKEGSTGATAGKGGSKPTDEGEAGPADKEKTGGGTGGNNAQTTNSPESVIGTAMGAAVAADSQNNRDIIIEQNINTETSEAGNSGN
jgi:hypothetical protein